MDPDKKRKDFRLIGMYIDLGLRFAITILIGVFLGRWLDNRLDKEPLFTLIGLFLGAGSGFYSLYKTALYLEKKEKNNLNAK